MSVFVAVLVIAGLAAGFAVFLAVSSPVWGRLFFVALLTRALDRPQARRALRGRP